MKYFLILLAAISLSFTTPCYTVEKITTLVDAPEMSTSRVLFGIKQITEEVLSEKFSICMSGSPVYVEIQSIEAPTTGLAIGPLTMTKKETIIKIKITKDGIDYFGEGRAKTTVKSTFIELKDDNLPFEKTTFASAVKKSIVNAIDKM
jgi:hypothetical protein